MTSAQLTWLLGELIAEEGRAPVPCLRVYSVVEDGDGINVYLKTKRGAFERFRVTVDTLDGPPAAVEPGDNARRQNGAAMLNEWNDERLDAELDKAASYYNAAEYALLYSQCEAIAAAYLALRDDNRRLRRHLDSIRLAVDIALDDRDGPADEPAT